MPEYPSYFLDREKELREKREILQYSEEEKKQQNAIFRGLDDSWAWMNTAQTEFDGQTLIECVTQCRLTRNSFLEPIKNDGEVRVVTGVTEGKVDSVFNAVFNQNIETEIRAFNENDIEDYKLGQKLTRIEWRSEQIERDEDLWEEALDELLTMPAVFIQETMEDEWYHEKVITNGTWDDLWQFKQVTIEDRPISRRRKAVKVLWPVEQVLLADPRIPARLLHKQPWIATYAKKSIEELQVKYGQSPRWKYVHGGNATKNKFKANEIFSSDWRFGKLDDHEGEEIIWRSLQDNEMQVYVNGVPMLPVGTPFRRRYHCYDMLMSIPKRIHGNIAYGRSDVMKSKVLQALRDEDFRLMILQRRQQIFQPIVTKTNAILSKDMFLPSAITYGVDKEDVQSLLDSKFSANDKVFSDIVEKEIERFMNVSSVFQGISEKGNKTAHEVATQMKQALIMLGHALTSYMRMKRDASYLRLYNLLEEFLYPVGMRYNDLTGKNEPIFDSYTISDTEIFGGQIGKEIIQFVDRQLLPEEEDMAIRMDQDAKENGNPTQRTFLDVNKLKSVPYLFYVTAITKEKRSSILEREMFKKDLVDGLQIGNMVGRMPSADFVLREYRKRTDLDVEQMFPAVPPMGMEQQGMQPQQQGGAPQTPQFNLNKLAQPNNQGLV